MCFWLENLSNLYLYCWPNALCTCESVCKLTTTWITQCLPKVKILTCSSQWLNRTTNAIISNNLTFIKLIVCLYLIWIHISEPISTKLCTYLPLGLEETVGYVWSENALPFLPFWPFVSGASAESSARNGCRHSSHPRQRYIRDSCWCYCDVTEMTL